MSDVDFFEIKDGIYKLNIPYDDGFTSIFALENCKEWMLVDFGATDYDGKFYIIPAIKKIGFVPKYLVCSHIHEDHSGGLKIIAKEFPKAEIWTFSHDLKIEKSINYLADEKIFLERYKFFSLKGHTDCSCGILDMKNNVLLSFDCLQGIGIGKYSPNIDNANEYEKTLKKILSLNLDGIVASHEYEPFGSVAFGKEEVFEYIDTCRKAFEKICFVVKENFNKTSKEIADIYNFGKNNLLLGEWMIESFKKYLMNKERKPMIYIFDNDLHIHSQISLCSGNPKQTNERILQYAKDNNLKTICLTDHFWDETVEGLGKECGVDEWYGQQNYDHISKALPLPKAQGINFLFGCETEMNKDMTVGLSKENFDKFDFVVIPTTHFHMKGFTIPEECESAKEKADFWLKKLNALFDMDLPFYKIGIAHLICSLMDGTRNGLMEMIKAIDEEEMRKVFKKASEKGVGIELNSDDMDFRYCEADILLKPFQIAKEEGCKFYCGSDAHGPERFEIAKPIFERAIDMLGLTEEDKFHIKNEKGEIVW